MGATSGISALGSIDPGARWLLLESGCFFFFFLVFVLFYGGAPADGSVVVRIGRRGAVRPVEFGAGEFARGGRAGPFLRGFRLVAGGACDAALVFFVGFAAVLGAALDAGAGVGADPPLLASDPGVSVGRSGAGPSTAVDAVAGISRGCSSAGGTGAAAGKCRSMIVEVRGRVWRPEVAGFAREKSKRVRLARLMWCTSANTNIGSF